MRALHAVFVALGVLAVSATAPAAFADEPPVEERAFVEVAASRESVYVGQEIVLVLRFGYDEPWFREHAAPLFRRELDVPVDVSAPWLAELPGATVLAEDSPDIGWPLPKRFALNGGIGEAPGSRRTETREGRTHALLEVERRYRATKAGALRVEAPTLRFAYASRFDVDLAGGRVAADRRDVVVHGAPLSIRIDALPEAGRPPGFSGAVGRFTVKATADRTELREGKPVEIDFQIIGDGSLEGVTWPRLDAIDGWQLSGLWKPDVPMGLPPTRTYEFVPKEAGLLEFPAISFAFFDPTPPGSYRVARSAPIPILVEARPAAPGPSRPAGNASDERSASPWPWIAGTALAVLLAMLLLRLGRRRSLRGADVDDPIRAAATVLSARALRSGTDLSEPFAEFLAAMLRCSPAAVVSPDLAARLATGGVPADLAARTAATAERLVAARYGGPLAPDAASVLALAKELAELRIRNSTATGRGT